MEQKELLQLTEQWEHMTHMVLDLKRISSEELQRLLKGTYKILNFYHRDRLVPKEVCKIILEMDAFLYFASLLEEKEVYVDFYFYQTIHRVVEALKEGFFKGEYEYKFPVLKVYDAMGELHIMDMENGCFDDFM